MKTNEDREFECVPASTASRCAAARARARRRRAATRRPSWRPTCRPTGTRSRCPPTAAPRILERIDVYLTTSLCPRLRPCGIQFVTESLRLAPILPASSLVRNKSSLCPSLKYQLCLCQNSSISSCTVCSTPLLNIGLPQ